MHTLAYSAQAFAVCLCHFVSNDIFPLRHLRFLIRSAEHLISTPATPASIQKQSTLSDTRMDAVETDQADTKKKVAIHSAKLEEAEDGRLNET